MTRYLRTSCLAVALGAVLLAAAVPAALAEDRAGPPRAWTDSDAMLVFYEALTKLDRQALRPHTTDQAVRGALKAYLRSLDPYGDYLTAREYAAWRQAQAYHFLGVGMDLVEDRQGRIICLPQPDGPAAKGGVRAGDVLLAVDGSPVRGKSLYLVGAGIRGRAGGRVGLRLQPARGGPEREVSLERAAVTAKSLWTEDRGAFLLVRLASFSPHTPRELAAVLRAAPRRPLVIDLRGNAGGDLFAAVDAAGLFLPAGALVMTLKTRKGGAPYRVPGPTLAQGSPVFILQDRYTASAAEVFAAALVQNRRAESLGQTSFGKGRSQRVLELSDGSALVFTYAEIIPPDGKPYDGKGLEPTRALPAKSRDAAWTAAVNQSLARPGSRGSK